jgi:hypothetical protein
MKASVTGHAWEDRYLSIQGSGREAQRKETAAPGGAWWLAAVLEKAGMTIPGEARAIEGIRKEYYDCAAQAGIAAKQKEPRCMLTYSGCMEGRTLLERKAQELAIVLDEGFDNPPSCPEGCARLLWVSRARIPDGRAMAAFPGDTVLLLDADLLRRSGALISRQVSWERTATDAVWQLCNNPIFRHLLAAREVIVPFAEEGFVTLEHSKAGEFSANLHLSSGAIEGAARFAYQGEHPKAWGVMVASAALAASHGPLPAVPSAFPAAAEAVRKMTMDDLQRDGGIATATQLLSEKYLMGSYEIPCSHCSPNVDSGYWRILDHIPSTTTDRIAENIVKEGLTSIQGVPRITFGKWTSIDRSEIESFMCVRNLIEEYARGGETKPLSIAVFGTPGSGKSFGISQVAENILPGRIVKVEFNLSQLAGKSELTAALHKVRDVALRGKLPLVFFDEFDSDFEGQKLGWLKYFLMPMQDGVFLEGGAEHPIGRCIFVFAGGTCSSFEQFAAPLGQDEEDRERKLFNSLKGPDFISRLRGAINVLGPNRSDDRDKSFLLRRALLLRGLCEKNLSGCFAGATLRIDESILTAMLLVPKYLHGARSMESIIGMSRMADCTQWEPASLPTRSQLALHVDADAFLRLVLRDVLLGSCREQLARQIHANYCKIQKENNNTESGIKTLEWERLSEEYREANRAQADDIINKLGRFGYGYDAGDSFFETVKEFPQSNLEAMAVTEHDRWMQQRLSAGWRFAPGPKNEQEKTSPYLVPWDQLEDKVKELDRDAVRGIIPLFERIGMRVYKRD